MTDASTVGAGAYVSWASTNPESAEMIASIGRGIAEAERGEGRIVTEADLLRDEIGAWLAAGEEMLRNVERLFGRHDGSAP